jgi:hypothetical protein
VRRAVERRGRKRKVRAIKIVSFGSFCLVFVCMPSTSDRILGRYRMSAAIQPFPPYLTRIELGISSFPPLTNPRNLRKNNEKKKQLHNYTTPTASSFLLTLANLHLLTRTTASRPTASTSGIASHLLIVASDLAHDVVEGVVDVDSGFR